MEKKEIKASSLLIVSGTILVISGVLTGISVNFGYMGILCSASSLVFFAAYHMKKRGH